MKKMNKRKKCEKKEEECEKKKTISDGDGEKKYF